MHVVISASGTYVNGVSVGSGSAVAMGGIGASFEGYLAEFHFIDGAALDPTSFGEFNADGVWMPKKVSGVTYGAKGFHLDFSDPANIGKDRSGNNNDFTATGFELTTKDPALYDWMEDSPVNNQSTNYNLLVAGVTAPGVASAGYSVTSWYWPRDIASWNWQVPTLGIVPNSGKWWIEFYGVFGSTGDYLVIGLSPIKDAASAVVNTYVGNVSGYGWMNPKGGGVSRWADSGAGSDVAAGLVPSPGARYKLGFAIDCDQATPVVQLWQNPANNAVDTAGWVMAGTRTLDRATVDAGLIVTVSTYYGNVGPSPFSTNPTATTAGYRFLRSASLPAPNLPATITGTFTGNNNADGPFVYTGCIPGRIQYGSVDVTYGNRLPQNDVDFLCNGFKVRSTTSNSGTVNYTVTTTHPDGEYSGKKVPFGGAGISPAPACSN